jgi:hypothetical protein
VDSQGGTSRDADAVMCTILAGRATDVPVADILSVV